MDTALNNLTLGQQDEAAERLRQEKNSGEEADSSGAESGSFRIAQTLSRRREEEGGSVDNKSAEGLIKGELKERLLNLIPFRGPLVVIKYLITGKAKKKPDALDFIIMLLPNIEVFFIVLGALALIALIASWSLNPLEALKAIWNMELGGIKGLTDLFSGLLKSLVK